MKIELVRCGDCRAIKGENRGRKSASKDQGRSRITEKPCACGSGEPREELHDGYGIFMCFVCSACKARKLARFRPDIFTKYECDEPIEPED